MNEIDRTFLEFESTQWRFEGAKHEAIVTTLNVSPTRYYQIVNRLLSDPAAEAEFPVLVHRLRRLRDHRQSIRWRS